MTGAQAKDALEFAVGSLGNEIAGRPVEIVVGDAQGDPSAAVDLARKMVEQDGVVAVFGPTQIGQKSAVSEYMKEAGVPLIFYNPTPGGLFMSNEWLVGSGGTAVQMPTVMAEYAYSELGYRKVHTLAMDNAGGKSFIEPFVEAFEARGGEVLQQQWAPVPTPDFSPYLVTLSDDADALVAWTSGSDAIALWGAWSDLGLKDKLPIITPMHGGFTDSFVAGALSKANPAACEAMMGALAPMMYTYGIDSPENAEFVAAWTEAFGERPGGTNMPGSNTQAIYLFKNAVEATGGDTTPDVLLAALLATSFNGPEGHLSFADGQRGATKDVYIVKVVQLDDGSFNYEVVKKYADVPPSGL
jgi:branched-chain amino acid transport system substrate-binding protein